MSQGYELSKLGQYLTVNTAANTVTLSSNWKPANVVFNDGSYLSSAVGNISVFSYTGDGATIQFSMGNYTPASVNQIDVFVGGVYQRKSTYTINGSNVVFTQAPPSGSAVELNVSTLNFGIGTPGDRTITPTKFTATGANSTNFYRGDGTWASVGTIYVASNTTLSSAQYLVDSSAATATNLTLTLPASPALGMTITLEDANNSWGANNVTVNPNGATVMGYSSNLILDVSNQMFTLWYNGSDWRIL